MKINGRTKLLKLIPRMGMNEKGKQSFAFTSIFKGKRLRISTVLLDNLDPGRFVTPERSEHPQGYSGCVCGEQAVHSPLAFLFSKQRTGSLQKTFRSSHVATESNAKPLLPSEAPSEELGQQDGSTFGLLKMEPTSTSCPFIEVELVQSQGPIAVIIITASP